MAGYSLDDVISSRMNGFSVDDSLTHTFNVVRVDKLRKSHYLSNLNRNSNLIDLEVRVRRNDLKKLSEGTPTHTYSSTTEIDTLAGQITTESTLFALEALSKRTKKSLWL